MPTPPQLTPEQRAAALEKAALARRVRAEVKERLKMGVLSLPDLFREMRLMGFRHGGAVCQQIIHSRHACRSKVSQPGHL